MKKPTRVTAKSETLIDHVYSSTPENITDVSVPVLAVSDHYPVCITRKLSKAFDTGPVHKFINYRNTKTFDEEQFLNDLANQPWSVADIFDDAMMHWITFLKFLTLSYQLMHPPPPAPEEKKNQTTSNIAGLMQRS